MLEDLGTNKFVLQKQVQSGIRDPEDYCGEQDCGLEPFRLWGGVRVTFPYDPAEETGRLRAPISSREEALRSFWKTSWVCSWQRTSAALLLCTAALGLLLNTLWIDVVCQSHTILEGMPGAARLPEAAARM